MVPAMHGRARNRGSERGFTLVELVVVMALIGLLLSLAVPNYLESLDRGREQVLVHNQAQLRKAIDQFFADRGTYPDRLDDLVEQRYLRSLPANPFSGQADWELVSPPAGAKGQVYDVLPPHGWRQKDAGGGLVQPAAEPAAGENPTARP